MASENQTKKETYPEFQRRMDTLTTRFDALERERQLLSALVLARESLWESDEEELELVHRFEETLARAIIHNSQRIWELCGAFVRESDKSPF